MFKASIGNLVNHNGFSAVLTAVAAVSVADQAKCEHIGKWLVEAQKQQPGTRVGYLHRNYALNNAVEAIIWVRTGSYQTLIPADDTTYSNVRKELIEQIKLHIRINSAKSVLK